MPPVGAAIAAVAGAIGTAVSGASAFVAGLGVIGKAVLTIGLSVGAQLLQGSLTKKQQSNGLHLNLKTGGNVPRAAVFGRTATEGHLVYFNTYGAKNGFVQLVYQLSDGGECDALEKVWVDGEETELKAAVALGQPMEAFYYPKTGRYYGWLRFFNGADNQAADSQLVDNANPSGRWTANHRGRGCCYVSITLQFHEKVFNSIPSFRFQLRGLKLYDWRKDSTNGGVGSHRWDNRATWEWSDNPAVVLYNYQRGLHVLGQKVLGEGVAVEDLDHALYTAAANACDENVSLKAGGTEKRYRFGGTVSDEVEHAENLSPILQAMGGDLLERVGEFAPIAGVAQTPVMTITDADLVVGENWTYSGSLTRSELVNAVFGQFADPTQMWELASFPPRTSTAAENEDGGQRHGTDLTLGGVSSGTQAQRIAEITRRMARLQRTEEIVVGAKFRPIDPGDWINRQSGRYGNYIARVMSRSMSPNGKISLSLREIDASVYAWNPAVDELAGTVPADLPSTGGLIETVSGLDVDVVEIAASGGVKRPALKITWTPPDDATITDVVIEIRVQGDTRPVVTRFQDVEAGEGYILDGVQAGAIYEARATIITQPARATEYTAWVTSAEATGTQVVPEATLASSVVDGSIYLNSLAAEVRDALDSAGAVVDEVAGLQADLSVVRKATSNDPAVRAEVADQWNVEAFNDVARMAYQLNHVQGRMLELDQGQTAVQAQFREAMGVRFNNTEALFAQEINLVASETSALSQQLTTLSTTVDGNTASISTVASSVDGVKLQYGVTGTIDGVTGGFVLMGVKMLNGLIDYTVAIAGNLIVTGSITADKLTVSTLSAITVNAGIITAGMVTGPSNKLQVDANNERIVVYD